jgi:hypothetical protein
VVSSATRCNKQQTVDKCLHLLRLVSGYCLQRISHGRLDVNRLAVMPQQPNIVATCCDESEVRYTARNGVTDFACQRTDLLSLVCP